MAWGTLIIAYLSLLVLGLGDVIRGPLLYDIMKEFTLTDLQGSYLFAVGSTCALFGSLSSPFLARHFKQYSLLQAALFLMSLGLFIVSQSLKYEMALFGVGLFGFTVGTLGVSQNYLVSRASLNAQRSRALSGLHSMYGLAALLAPLMVGILTGWGWPWRSLFLLASVMPLIVLFGSFFRPKGENIDDQAHKSSNESSKLDPPKDLYVMPLVLAFYVVAEILVGTRFALFLQRDFGMDIEKSSFLLTFLFVLLLAGRVISVFIDFSASLRKVLIGSLFSSALLFMAGILWHPYWMVLVGLSMAPFYPLCISYISHLHPRWLHKSVSLSMIFQGLAVVLMHVSVGRLSDLFGLKFALWLGPLVLLAGLILMLLKDKHVLEK